MKRKFLFGLLCMLAFLPLSGVVMFLWNLLLPQLMHVPVINYWQALGLMVLCHILFGGFDFGGRRGRSHHDGDLNFLRDKLDGMNDEQRAAFKDEWRKRREGHRRH